MSFSPNSHIPQLIRWINEGIPSIEAVGLSGTVLAYHLSLMLKKLQKPCLIMLPQAKDSEVLMKAIKFFLESGDNRYGKSDLPIHDFPAYDLSPLTGLGPHREVVANRIHSLYALLNQADTTVMTSLEAALWRILPKESFLEGQEYLVAGEDAERDALIERLDIIGYQRTSLVEEIADYSVRGSVIDLFPPSNRLPVRLEFWGDHLESIRYFDPLSQRSKESLKELVILPANEIIKDKPAVKRARSMGRLPQGASGGMSFPGQEGWLNHFYSNLNTLFHYLPHDALLILINCDPLDRKVQKIQTRFEKEVEKNRDRAAEAGEPFPDIERLFLPVAEFAEHISAHQRLFFNELDLQGREEVREKVVFEGHFSLDAPLELHLEGKGKVSLAPLAEKMSRWRDQGGRVVLLCRTLKQAQRLKEILENYGLHLDDPLSGWGEVPDTPGFSICLGRLSKGFSLPETGLYVVTEDEIFGAKRSRSRSQRSRGTRGLGWSGFSQLKNGDLVVHEEHGVGRYGGLRKMEIAQKVNDFVIVEYADHDRLYIPADRVGILQKYIGAGDGDARLDRLGGSAWNLQKQKARKSVRHIARQLIDTYALRRYRKGYSFSSPDSYFREFEATFEHEETPDQIKAIEDVLEDMISENPMDRLVCGDVGYGKTEVAIRAAFKANTDGKQVALLVPTTVLAEQHFETFRKRMTPHGICVEVVSRFKSRKEQMEVLGRLRSGQVDILIGTHRLLQKDVHFRDLGLLIIDEEQRFGVKQKEAIKKYRALIDVLAITATPVPRTLQISMLGVRDLSIIETPPEERLAIRTHLIHYDEATISTAIQNELERDGQVFFVHNRVRTIDQIADQLRRIVPNAHFAVAHGQMKEKKLEETMLDFLHKKIDVLVSSTIIESGLDIPSANTIIINEVDRLGLAQIYQLRGRVGRSKQKAYAYLLLSDGAQLSRDAEKRLKALMDFSHLGAGIHLAMHDLKIRGGGNILGYAQAGHISAMGYELYVKLIEQAVAELKGEMWQDEIDPEINIDLQAFLPNDYVVDTDIRLNLYRRLSMLDALSGLTDMEAEIRDRFGPPPSEVKNLLVLMSLRLFLKQTGISRLDAGHRGITLVFSPTVQRKPEKWIELAERNRGRYQFLNQNTLKINTGSLNLPDDLPKIQSAIEKLPLTRISLGSS